ncbi:CirA Outer membrane receptor proteins, mostly Fe transport [Methylophilaceae bacterium]
MPFNYSKKHRLLSNILTPCVLAALASMAQAEELVLPNVAVNAEKLADINASAVNTSDSAALLADEPGVTLYRAGGVSSLPAIHGLADDRVRVKLDGMDLIASCPNHMNPPLSYIDPTNIDNIKVYAGITPVSVGGDSIGGTIMVNSAKPEFAAAGAGNLVKGQISSFYRSNNDAYGGNVSATFANESFSANYTGASSQADNYKAGKNFKSTTATLNGSHTLPLDEVGSTAYETTNHTLGFAFKRDNHILEAKFGYQNMPEQLYPNQRMDLLDNEQKRVNLRYLGEFDWGNLESRVYHEAVSHFMEFGPDKKFLYTTDNTTQGMPMNSKGNTSGATIKADLNLTAKDTFRVGSEYQHYALQDWWPAVTGSGGMGPNEFLNINDGERERLALFTEWEKSFASDLTGLAGVRYEHVKTNADMVHGYNLASAPISGSGGMMNQTRDAANFNNADRNKTDNNLDATLLGRYKANANADIEMGFARKVRSPNLYERYTWSTYSMMAIMNNTVGDGNGYLGDVNLKSEKAHTVSATLDWHAANRDWAFKATPYFTYVNDYIDAVQWNGSSNAVSTTQTNDAYTTLRYVNQSARLYGLDVSGYMPLAQSSVGQFAVKGLLNYTHGENRATGDNLYNIMPLNGKLTLTHNYQDWDNALEVQMVKAKDHTSDARNEIKTAGYSLVNLRSSYNWKQARLDFGVENLFDKHYYLPLGGAYVGQGATMGMQNSPIGWGTAVPGMGRSVNVGLTLKY